MKTRRSLDDSNQPLKRRKQSKRFSLNPSNLEKQKDNNEENQQKENNSPKRIKAIFSQNDVEEGANKAKRRKGNFVGDFDSSLQANNRALAIALGESRVQINSVNQENISLKRQLYCERQSCIERIRKEVEMKVQSKFKAFDEILQETILKLLEISKLISSAIDMVSMPTTATTDTPASHPIPPDSCDTTPPPDRPDYMELTLTDTVPMETNEKDLSSCHLQGLNHEQTPKFTTTQLPNNEQEIFIDEINDPYPDDTSMMSDELTAESLLDKPMRRKRRSGINISYAMPSLRSKLRRGDPFTDSFFQETSICKQSKRKVRMSTGCIQKKSRHALSNLTNIIREEQEVERK